MIAELKDLLFTPTPTIYDMFFDKKETLKLGMELFNYLIDRSIYLLMA